jgi:hypothetical protein
LLKSLPGRADETPGGSPIDESNKRTTTSALDYIGIYLKKRDLTAFPDAAFMGGNGSYCWKSVELEHMTRRRENCGLRIAECGMK